MGAGKRLLKVMVTWTENPAGMVDGKAANQNDLCCGPKKMCASGNIKTIKHRTEVDISDYHAWRTDRIGQTESFVWIGGSDNFESRVTKYVLYGRADEIIVIYEQNLEARTLVCSLAIGTKVGAIFVQCARDNPRIPPLSLHDFGNVNVAPTQEMNI
jgi:hypothetical protein